MIINISGAGGAGKSTLVARLTSLYPERYVRLVTYTTRPIRPGEIDGVAYYFVDAGSLEGDEYVLKRIRAEGVYAVKRSDLETAGRTLLTTFPPSGVPKLEIFGHEVFLFHLHLNESSRSRRMRERGDSVEGTIQKIERDKEESTLNAARRILAKRRIHILDARKPVDELAAEFDQIARSIP